MARRETQHRHNLAVPEADLLQVTASLAYRNNERDILRGKIPQKYLRLLPYIPGDKVLEIGSAEGVLSLCLARQDMGAKKEVVAVEQNANRHANASVLHRNWSRVYRFACHPAFVNGAVQDHLDLLNGMDTLLAVRSIYYLGENLDAVFAAAAKTVPNVVLCGNKNRAKGWRMGLPNQCTKANDYYASPEGMIDVLKRHGYRIVTDSWFYGDETEDPIIVGRIDG